jgi:hypothetical protein
LEGGRVVDYETVLPFKAVNDIVKEIKETEGVESLYEFTSATFGVSEEKQCGCGHCTCGDQE